jgi:hypothetical protein
MGTACPLVTRCRPDLTVLEATELLAFCFGDLRDDTPQPQPPGAGPAGPLGARGSAATPAVAGAGGADGGGGGVAGALLDELSSQVSLMGGRVMSA